MVCLLLFDIRTGPACHVRLMAVLQDILWLKAQRPVQKPLTVTH